MFLRAFQGGKQIVLYSKVNSIPSTSNATTNKRTCQNLFFLALIITIENSELMRQLIEVRRREEMEEAVFLLIFNQ